MVEGVEWLSLYNQEDCVVKIVVLRARIRIELLWQTGEVDVRGSYIVETGPVTDASLRIHEAEAERFVLHPLLHIDEAKAIIVVHPLFPDVNEV